MIKLMVVGFCCVRGWCYSEWWVWDLRIQFQKSEVSLGLFQDCMNVKACFSILQKDIQSLAMELFKLKNKVSKRILYDIFEHRNFTYNLRSQTDFIRTSAVLMPQILGWIHWNISDKCMEYWPIRYSVNWKPRIV